MSIANYTIQEWLFNEAKGKFKFDLAESGVQFQYVKDLSIDDNWCLDYSYDRGCEDLRELIKSQYTSDTASLNAVVTHGAQEALYIFIVHCSAQEIMLLPLHLAGSKLGKYQEVSTVMSAYSNGFRVKRFQLKS